MRKGPNRAEIERLERHLIVVLSKISEANRTVVKTLALGYLESAVFGAILDLRSAANDLEAAKARMDAALSEANV